MCLGTTHMDKTATCWHVHQYSRTSFGLSTSTPASTKVMGSTTALVDDEDGAGVRSEQWKACTCLRKAIHLLGVQSKRAFLQEAWCCFNVHSVP